MMTNEVIETEWGWISYNPDTGADNPFDDLMVLMTGKKPPTGEETAICHDDKYYILYGDWRDVLRGKTLQECLEVFMANSEHHGFTSDHPEDDRGDKPLH